MQNRYTGDIGDFGKLGLLRALQASGLTIGVNWYLVPDENHNSDGRHVQYLENADYCQLDEPLWLELKRIVKSGQREVSALENDNIINAAFFSEPLVFAGKSKAERAAIRKGWHEKALMTLSGADVIFVDPDNGIVVPSALGTVKENKFVKPDELVDYYKQGSSVIYYQHKARRSDSFYVDQHKRLIEMLGLGECTGLGLKFTKTSQRFYFFMIQPKHNETIPVAVRRMLANGWSDYFEVVS